MWRRSVRQGVTCSALALVLALSGCASASSDESSPADAQESLSAGSTAAESTEADAADTTSSNTGATGYATESAADGYETLGGIWEVVAITYQDNPVSLKSSEALADLYDNVYLSFDEDGTFVYWNSVYVTSGKYTPSTGMDDAYLLIAQVEGRATVEDDEIVITDQKESERVYLVVTSEDTVDTLGFEELDASTGKPKEGEEPIYFGRRESSGGSSGVGTSGSSSDSRGTSSGSTSYSGSSSASSSASGSVSSSGGSSSYGTERQRAAERAKQYLRTTSFSHDGLVEQLEYEGFSHTDAVYGADASGANWNEQALLKAKQYLQTTAFSESGLVEQLVYEQFTQEQAEYGVSRCGADWMEQAVKKARQYLSWSSMSRSKLIDQLEYEGFTYQQAVYGVDNA